MKFGLRTFIVAIVHFTIWLLNRREQLRVRERERQRTGTQIEEQGVKEKITLIGEFIKAKKAKICPYIEFSDNEKENATA